MIVTRFCCALMLVLLVVGTPPALSQQVQAEQDTSFVETKQQQLPPKFGGPSSVVGALRRDKKVKLTLLNYFEYKDRIRQEYGLDYGIGYLPVYQGAETGEGTEHTADGVVRLYARWELVKRGTTDNGAVVGKVEYRHRMGTRISPQDLGLEAGYVGSTTTPFGDTEWILANLFWEQHLAENRLAFVAGIVDVTDYINTYALNDPWTHFLNQAFATDPTISAPSPGLGAAVSVRIGHHFLAGAGIADANGDPTDPVNSLSSFFDTGEYFTHAEISWSPSFERRFTDSARLTTWHSDELEAAQVPGGWGMAMSWNHLVGERWQPFVRAGWAEEGSAVWDRSLSGGLGFFPRGAADLLSLGLNWSRPSRTVYESELKDQYTVEMLYRWRPFRAFTITPNVQFLFDPALNPDEDLVMVFGARGRLAL
ncbi:MAG: carbohydrate porin [Candidatus Krumholzibacteria bacterium]|nr:carbohydrate porin [Candidatus Krumholzibacteria bacterium]